ncbi:hypothetical protein C6380_09935, partial [Pseudomonas syringae pv. actinidiae]
LDSPGVPWTLVLLPVPGSSRTSPLLQKSRDRGQAKRRTVRIYKNRKIAHTLTAGFHQTLQHKAYLPASVPRTVNAPCVSTSASSTALVSPRKCWPFWVGAI